MAFISPTRTFGSQKMQFGDSFVGNGMQAKAVGTRFNNPFKPNPHRGGARLHAFGYICIQSPPRYGSVQLRR
jgi:hypothetical protein